MDKKYLQNIKRKNGGNKILLPHFIITPFKILPFLKSKILKKRNLGNLDAH